MTTCKKTECTVDQTGICLLNNDVKLCPHRITETEQADIAEVELSVPPPLTAPAKKPQFPNSLTQTPEATRAVTGSRYFRLIGVLGAPDSGKTAVLVSLYLLLSHGSLDSYTFADSLSLLAFDEISRRARQWNDGTPPEQMTNHTDLSDNRTAGFLHLRLRYRQSDEVVDVLIPDLPGEWSTSMIDTNRVDRLDFLRSADSIWLMVDGRQLINPATRQHVIHRTCLLMQRVSQFLSRDLPPVHLVISHMDSGAPPESTRAKLTEEARRFNIALTIHSVSSFSDNNDIKPGSGINELITSSLIGHEPETQIPTWLDTIHSPDTRQMLKFRVERTKH